MRDVEAALKARLSEVSLTFSQLAVVIMLNIGAVQANPPPEEFIFVGPEIGECKSDAATPLGISSEDFPRLGVVDSPDACGLLACSFLTTRSRRT